MDYKKDNFKRIAEVRKNKIIELISKLRNLSNSSFYEYTDEEMNSIFNEIQVELDRQREEFNKINKNNKNNKDNKRVEL